MTKDDAGRLKALLRERWVNGEILKSECDELIAEIELEYRAQQREQINIPRRHENPNRKNLRGVRLREPEAGMIIGRYELLSPLHGWMGVIFQARNLSTMQSVALKFLPPELQDNVAEIARIKAMFNLVHDLHHPSICSVYDLDEHAEFGWFQVMRWIEGQTLSAHLRDKHDHFRCLSVTEVADLLLPVAEALDYAHSRMVLHRSINPQNIMRAVDGSISVINFGLEAEVRGSLTRMNKGAIDFAGTEPYLAPELWKGGYASTKSDQYALGITAYELLSGHYPFNADNQLILMHAVLNAPIPVLDDVPPATMSALQRGLARQATDRFETCRELVKSLSAGLSSGAAGLAHVTIPQFEAPFCPDEIADGRAERADHLGCEWSKTNSVGMSFDHTPLLVDLDFGSADAEDGRDLFAALSAAYQATGGSGLKIVKHNQRSVCHVDEKVPV